VLSDCCALLIGSRQAGHVPFYTDKRNQLRQLTRGISSPHVSLAMPVTDCACISLLDIDGLQQKGTVSTKSVFEKIAKIQR